MDTNDIEIACAECGYSVEGDAVEGDLCAECLLEAREAEHEYNCDWADDRDSLIDGVGFADEGSGSALRAATRDNPRNLPCPTCGEEDRLTPLDRARGYQCDSCADRAEGRGGYGDY